jgi:hypothetical protein
MLAPCAVYYWLERCYSVVVGGSRPGRWNSLSALNYHNGHFFDVDRRLF